MVQYAVVVLLIRSLLEALKSILPLSQWAIKAAVFVLAGGFTYAYGLNALAEVGLASKFLVFDQAATVVVIAVAAFAGHDILDKLRRS